MILYQKNLVLLSSLIVAAVTVPLANAADVDVEICMGEGSKDDCSKGQLRKATVHIPPGLPSNGSPNKLPLVLNLHGAVGNGAETVIGQQGFSGFDEVADREKIVVAYPNGFGRARVGTPFASIAPDAFTWNAGGCCADACDPNALTPSFKEKETPAPIDDIGYLRELVRYIKDDMPKDDQNFVIDPERIYATGMSNGGFMTNRIGCEMSDIVAAIVPVAGPLMNEAAKNPPIPPLVETFFGWIPDAIPNPKWLFETPFLWDSDPFECKPERPVPVLHIHSIGDLIVPFDGSPKFGFPTVDSSIKKWRTLNGVDKVEGVINSFDGGNTTCTSYGPTSKNVTLCKVDSNAHCWPGKEAPERSVFPFLDDLLEKLFFCEETEVGNEDIWDFMKQHTLSGGDAVEDAVRTEL